MRLKWLVLGPLVLVAFVAFVAFGVWIVMGLWNWLMPALFGLPSITYLQALGLLVLCRILFGGFGGHGAGWRARRRMSERWDHLPRDKRERIREKIRERFGTESPVGSPQGE